MSARDTPKQVRTRASEREPGSPYVAGGPRSMASKVAVNRLRKEYRCLPRIAAPRIAVLPQSTPRHLLRRPDRRHRRHRGHRLPRRLQCRPPGHRHRCFEPPPFIRAAPLESNLQEWHYVLQGPPDSPYSGGLQHDAVKSALARSSPRAISYGPRGRACSGSASAPERKAPRCFGDDGEPWRALAPRTR